MIDDSDYEILPHNELEHLRAEVERLKKNPLGEKYGGHDLIQSVKTLTETINHMNDIFTTTNQEMINDYQNNSLQNNFKMISSQNEQIAKGILSVVDLISKQTEILNKVSETLDKLNNNSISGKMNQTIQTSETTNFPKPEINDFNAMNQNQNMQNNLGMDKFNPSNQQNTSMNQGFPANQNTGMNIPSQNNMQGINLPEPPPKKRFFG
jgi:hypothetical protein